MSRSALCTVVLALGLALAPALRAGEPAPGKEGPPAGELFAQYPALSPDGKRLAFSLHGDLWIVPAEGGFAQRITLSDAYDARPRWSPDGARIAFSSLRAGNWDVWVTAAEAGKPEPITFDTAADGLCDWSADGASILFHSNRAGPFQVYRMPAGGGFAAALTPLGGRDGTFSSDGKTLAYALGQADLSQSDYHGSSNWDLYVQEDGAAAPRRVTAHEGNDVEPLFSRTNPRELYYLSERGGVYNLFVLDVGGGEPRALTRHADDVRHPFLSFDGKSVVYEMGFRLWRLDLASGESRPIPIAINADPKGPESEPRSLSDGAEDPSWSPDGAQIAFQLRGDLWTMPAAGGAARRITSGPARDEWPKFSPDGRRIAFFSDRSGNKDLWIAEADGRNPQQVTFDKADDFFHSWHPSGQKLVFCSTRSGNKDLWELDLRTGDQRPLTNDPQADDDPCYSPDGRWIAFDSGRGGSQNVYVMPAGGGPERRLTTGRFDQVPSWSPDGKFIAFERNDTEGGTPAVWVTEADGSAAMQVAAGGSAPRWSPKGGLIAFQHREGDRSAIQVVEAPERIVTGRPVPFAASVEVELAQERMQAFQEAWTRIRDGFYDPALHGVDWEAVRRKYEPAAAAIRTNEELEILIERMLGELKASHMGIWGLPASGRRPAPETGDLGWTLAAETDGVYRVEKVVPGGPADKMWIRPGDRVFEIDGKPLGPGADPSRLLAGKAGQQVFVRVGPTPSRDESRLLQVAAAPWGALRQIEYRNWVQECEERVKRAGGGLGYIHLRGMMDPDLDQFKKAVAGALAGTEGLILDVRNNGGGHIHQELLDVLTRRPFGAFFPRGGTKTLQPALYYTKPVVVLINERSFSDAEVFPYGFMALKRGLVVGVPTSGGVIGTGSTTLINGATLRMPSVGWFTLEGKNLEGLGVKPDVLVPETPEDLLAGRDPQLAKAVEVLKEQIAKAKASEGKGAEEKAEPKGKENTKDEGF